jgi:phospholipase A1
MRRKPCFGLALTLLAALFCVVAANPANAIERVEMSRCLEMTDPGERLQCYDELAPLVRPDARPEQRSKDCRSQYSAMSCRWDLDEDNEQSLYQLLPYKQNYVLFGRYSTDPNSHPESPAHGTGPDQDLQHAELKFQLSVKVKLAEHLLDDHADLWVGYTQQSSWQAYNASNSRPFRETDYEPEAMLVFPIHRDNSILGLRARFIDFGFVHQSNGQSDALSRSWNRAFAQLGFERGDFSVVLRGWYRIPESTNNDDNPDISHYLGYGDVVAMYKWEHNTFSLLLRNNLQTQSNRGAAQLDWNFPLPFSSIRTVELLKGSTLRAYVQLFTGYGETLIDYNHYQTTIGVGILLTDWM